MKTRPYNARDWEVRAFLKGRKTVIRVPVNPHVNHIQQLRDGRFETSWDGGFDNGVKYIKCPLGQPGDEIWVRETWANVKGFGFDRDLFPNGIAYKSDCKNSSSLEIAKDYGVKWLSPAIMPRWASRLILKVKSVHVERVREISEADALAEGVAIDRGNAYHVAGHEGKWAHMTARGCFETYYGHRYGTGAFERDWVFVVGVEK